jgi:hypothetical protein
MSCIYPIKKYNYGYSKSFKDPLKQYKVPINSSNDFIESDDESDDESIETTCKNNFNLLDLVDNVIKFKELEIKIDPSPSNEYFLKIFNKIYSDLCLNITTSLLDKIHYFKHNKQHISKQYIKYCNKPDLINILKHNTKHNSKHCVKHGVKHGMGNNIKNNAKIFLYAYVIIINHHEIFGFNNNLEQQLLKSSLDMLYIFIKLCEKISKKKYNRIKILLDKFSDKYDTYYENYHKWIQNDAKELIDTLTYTYYNLNNNLKYINENDHKYNQINKKLKEIEDKISFIILDDSCDKNKVRGLLYDILHNDNINKLAYQTERHFCYIQIYNLENNIRLSNSLKELILIIEKKLQYIVDTNLIHNINFDNNPIPLYLEYLNDKSLDFEIYSNKYFLKTVYYFIEKIDLIDYNLSYNLQYNSKIPHISNPLEDEINIAITQKKFKIFAQKFIKKDYIHIIPAFFKDILKTLYSFIS